MGKKRRMLTTKKFNAKHSAHPRMKLAARQNTEDVATSTEPPEIRATVETVTPPEIVVTAPPFTEEKVETKTVTPTVKKTTAPKTKKTATPRKKTAAKSTTTRKRTTQTKKTTRKN